MNLAQMIRRHDQLMDRRAAQIPQHPALTRALSEGFGVSPRQALGVLDEDYRVLLDEVSRRQRMRARYYTLRDQILAGVEIGQSSPSA